LVNDRLDYNFRKFVNPKIADHKHLHKFASQIYSSYCFLTGRFHTLPDFYILGGQKCGTTSLFLYLSKHPDVLSPTAKDIRFFDKYFFKGKNWYSVYFPTIFNKFVKKSTLTGEATERYLDHPHAPTRLKSVTPNAKFIILLRNPVDRAYSHYTMIVKHGQEKLSFKDAIKNEKEKFFPIYQKMLQDSNYYNDLYFRHGYLHRGIYVDKIKQWFKIFPKEQFLIIQSEDLFDDTNNVYQKILEFLELPEYELPYYEQYRKQNYESNKMDLDIQNELIDFFKPYNQQLSDLLGMEFNWNQR
jgi:hypothetical protein